MGELKRDTNTRPGPRPLSRKVRRVIEPSIYIGGNELIPRKKLTQIEQMILTRGVEETVLQIAALHPYLAELLQDPRAFTQFIRNPTFVSPKWKANLEKFAQANPKLRAVGLLLFLRMAYRNPPAVRQQLNRLAQAQQRRM